MSKNDKYVTNLLPKLLIAIVALVLLGETIKANNQLDSNYGVVVEHHEDNDKLVNDVMEILRGDSK